MWAGVSPVPVQMWAGVGPVPVQMWAGVGPVPVQMWHGVSPRSPSADRSALRAEAHPRGLIGCSAPIESAGIVGAAATHRAALAVLSAASDARFNAAVDQGAEGPPGFVAALPLRSKSGKVVGMLRLSRLDALALSRRDDVVLSMLARHAGLQVKGVVCLGRAFYGRWSMDGWSTDI
jgi:hypothetical protein